MKIEIYIAMVDLSSPPTTTYELEVETMKLKISFEFGFHRNNKLVFQLDE